MSMSNVHGGERAESIEAFNDFWARLAAVILALIGFASVVVGRTALVLEPSRYDTSLFAYIGKRWMHGAVLYRDIWDLKPPGIFMVTALASAMRINAFLFMALVEGLMICAAILLMFRLLRNSGASWVAALFACTIFAQISGSLFYTERGGLTEVYLLLPEVWTIYSAKLFFDSQNLKWALLAGLCTGVAVLFKLPGLGALIAVSLFAILEMANGRLGMRRARIAAGAFAVLIGVCAVWTPVVVYFSLHNAVRDMLEASFLLPFAYAQHSQKGIASFILINVGNLAPVAVPFILAIAMGGVIVFGRNFRQDSSRRAGASVAGTSSGAISLRSLALLAVLWLMVDFAAANASGRGYPHYYLPLAGSIGLLCGISLEVIFRAGRQRWMAFIVMALAVTPLTFGTLLDAYGVARNTIHGTAIWRSDARLVSMVRANERPGGTLFVWNYMPWVYLEAGQRAPWRFLTTVNIDDSPVMSRVETPSIRKSLRRVRPNVIVFARGRGAEIFRFRRSRRLFKWFVGFVASNYVKVGAVGSIGVYRLK